MDICIVSLMKERIETILSFIAYHKGIGVNHFILYIDDNDASIADTLSSIDGVRASPCNQSLEAAFYGSSRVSLGNRQRFYVDQALELAKKEGFDWITHIDSDELIYPMGDLRAILESRDSDQLAYRIYEAVPETHQPKRPYAASLFRRYWDARKRILLARLTTFDRPFFRGKYFRGHTYSKTMVRVTNNVLNLRVHAPLLAVPLPRPITDDLLLLHFDSISTNHWLEKWSRQIRHYTFYNHEKEREILAGIALKALDLPKSRQNRLFRRLYMFGPFSRWVLRTLKLLASVEIPEDSFEFSHLIDNKGAG